MHLKVNVTGFAENHSPQKHAVRNSYKRYPSGISWAITVKEIDVSIEEFFENLFLSAEKNGGNSYFYPNQDGSKTICRFEWHLPWRNRAATVRIGVVFELQKGETPTEAKGYLATAEMYGKGERNPKISKISGKKYLELKGLLGTHLEDAGRSKRKSELTRRLFIFYIQMPVSFKVTRGFSVRNGIIRILPSQMHGDKHIAAVLVKSTGKTRRDAQRKALERFSLFLALGSIATGTLWREANLENAPDEVVGKIDNFKISDAGKVYGKGFDEVRWSAKPLQKMSKSLIRSLADQFESFPPEKKEEFQNSLFAHYGALRISSENQALAIVGFLACMGALSKHLQVQCSGKVMCEICGTIHRHNLVGDRKAITDNLRSALSKSFALDEENSKGLESWIKRLYNKHRSQFVHSASHRFDEYNQSNPKSPTSGGPTAVPSEVRIVRELNEFTSDFTKLPTISRFLLLDQFGGCVEQLMPGSQCGFQVPDFIERYTSEAFVGFPTSGWVQVAGD